MRPKYSLMTGFLGNSWISKALSDNGLVEMGTGCYRMTNILVVMCN